MPDSFWCLPKQSITESIRELTKEKVKFIWTETRESAFRKIKTAITSAPVLRYFEKLMETVVQCDASSVVLGEAPLKKGQRMAFASRTLTASERNYAQIDQEKELLAVFAMTRFRHCAAVWETLITVDSDNKLIQAISIKLLASAPKRLQHMLLVSEEFDYEVYYRKGIEMHLTDSLY